MEKKSRKSIIISITSLLLVTLLLVGLTYAYYRTRIIGNESPDPSISVQSKKMEITYADGNGMISATNIAPGEDIKLKNAQGEEVDYKTFTVSNTGDSKVSYGVYLEEVLNEFSRYEDIKVTVTCSSNKQTSCNGYNENFPRLDSLLLMNTLEENEVHTYQLSLEYINEENIDQSEDMGKRLSGKVNIYDLTSVTLNTNTLAYKVLNNVTTGKTSTNYRVEPLSLPAQESTTIQEQIESASATTPLNDAHYYTYAKEVKFNELSGYSLVDPQVDTWANIKSNPQKLANFKYLRRENGVASIPSERTQTIKDMVKVNSTANNTLTYSMLELNPTENSIEHTLSATKDDYGLTFYYRGDVQDNFVEYNGMCWRIIRIQGDGTIKLLHESNDICKNAIVPTGLEGFYGTDDLGLPNYEESTYNPTLTMKSVLNNWLTQNNFNLNDLKQDSWCLGNLSDAYNFNAPYQKLDGQKPVDLIASNISFAYETYNRLYRRYPEQTSLECNGENDVKHINYIGAITADEAMFAGDKIGWTTGTTYLFNDNPSYFSSMSIMYYENVSNRKNAVLAISPVLNIGPVTILTKWHLKPTIVLKNTVNYSTGEGTKTNPYKIVES